MNDNEQKIENSQSSLGPELLGRVVRSERKALKLTQRKLGEFSGTGLNFISQLERGKPTARFDKILAVTKVLGLELHIKRGRAEISVTEELKS